MFSSKKRRGMFLAGVAIAALATASAYPAQAETRPQHETATSAQLVEVVDTAAPGTFLTSIKPYKKSGGDVSEYAANDTVVTVPTTLDDALIVSALDRKIEITLPFAERALEGEVLENGSVAFDNLNSSATLSVVHDDGSVQILTIIDAPDAPTRYDYGISASQGGRMTQLDNGSILITDENGDFAGMFQPAWATDADGNDVPTWYEINGNTLTQVVAHTSTSAYPIVADPWGGVQLFQWLFQYTDSADVAYMGTVTLGGAAILATGLPGQAILRDAGWAEWKAKWPAVTNKATLKQQFDCHVLAGYYGLVFTGPYNIERFRANKPAWLDGILVHQCNW